MNGTSSRSSTIFSARESSFQSAYGGSWSLINTLSPDFQTLPQHDTVARLISKLFAQARCTPGSLLAWPR